MKLKTTHGNLALALIGTLLISGAQADTIKLSLGTYRNSGSSGNGAYGGAFSATSASTFAANTAANYASEATKGSGPGVTGLGFLTFCMEYNEHFSPGGIYNYGISDKALLGSTLTGDPISPGTGFLYGLFARGLLDDAQAAVGEAFSYTSNSNVANLQEALWFLEGEHLSSGYGAGMFTKLLESEFTAVANAKTDPFAMSVHYGLVYASDFGVSALNLGDAPRYGRQDQLIYQGGGFQRIPDGGSTIMLVGMAMSGMALLRRKFA